MYRRAAEMTRGTFRPGNMYFVQELRCGKVLSGDPRFVKKQRELHAKTCQICRDCQFGNGHIFKAEVAPEMTLNDIVRKTVAKSGVECQVVS